MIVTNTTRDISELNPLVQVMLEAALTKIKKKKINPLVVETYRPLERQYYLYGKGRTKAICIGAGMPEKYATKYASPKEGKVTWTLASIHIKRCAVDLIPQRNGKAIWDSNDKQTKEIIKIMESVGFEAGANWQNSPDSPHFQVAGISEKSQYFTSKNTNYYITKMIQTKLKSLGFYNKAYAVDGVWGTATTNAVNKFRKKHGWDDNGKMGTKALKTLLS